MGNKLFCVETSCVECTRPTDYLGADYTQLEPMGNVFEDTLHSSNSLDIQLFQFVGTQNVVTCRWLMLLGANPLSCDTNGTMPLHVACRSGSIMIIRDLIARAPACLNMADNFAWTPLHVACSLSRKKVIQELLRANADPNVFNNKFQTPADLAVDGKTKRIIMEYTSASGELVSENYYASSPTSRGNGASGGSTMKFVSQFTASPTEPPKRDPDSMQAARSSRPSMNEKSAEMDHIVKYEPFFVPRKPILGEKIYRTELGKLGVYYFNKEPGRALAFMVATCCVQDFPIALSLFLKRRNCDLDKIGGFLGDSFSLAHVLRVEFLNSVRFCNTGVCSMLKKLFGNMHIPPDLKKIDRIFFDMAMIWWRQVEKRMEKEKPGISRPSTETESIKLLTQIHTFEAIYQMLFSCLFLHWNIHSQLTKVNQCRQVTFEEWLWLNEGIDKTYGDADTIGVNVSETILRQLYDTIANDWSADIDRGICASQNEDEIDDILSEVWRNDRKAIIDHYNIVERSSKIDFSKISRSDNLQGDFSGYANLNFCDEHLRPIDLKNLVSHLTGNCAVNNVFLQKDTLISNILNKDDAMLQGRGGDAGEQGNGFSAGANGNSRASAPKGALSVATPNYANSYGDNTFGFDNSSQLSSQKLGGRNSRPSPFFTLGNLMGENTAAAPRYSSSRSMDDDDYYSEKKDNRKRIVATFESALQLQMQQAPNVSQPARYTNVYGGSGPSGGLELRVPSTPDGALDLSDGSGRNSSGRGAAGRYGPRWASMNILKKPGIATAIIKPAQNVGLIKQDVLPQLNEHSENAFVTLACGLLLMSSSPDEPAFAFMNLRDKSQRTIVARSSGMFGMVNHYGNGPSSPGQDVFSGYADNELVIHKKELMDKDAEDPSMDIVLLFPDGRWDTFQAPMIKLRVENIEQRDRYITKINFMMEVFNKDFEDDDKKRRGNKD